MSRLIVNADDFAYTGGVNQAIFDLHAAGAVSSATAMATGEHWPGRLPETLSLGCHVVLVDGRPAAAPAAIASLLVDGRFRPTLGQFVLALQRGQIRDREIELEAVAQIRSLQARGVPVTHLDTHKHTHLFPRVLRPLLRAALQCGVTAIRNPFEPAWARAATHAPLLRRLQVRLLSLYRESFLREVERAGLRTTAGALGVLATGTLDAACLRTLLVALAQHGSTEACYELVCHPGYHDAALAAMPTRLQAERATEYAALLQLIPDLAGRLVSFRTL